jgi:hypothetical protein
MASFGAKVPGQKFGPKFYKGRDGDSPWNQDLLWSHHIDREKGQLFDRPGASDFWDDMQRARTARSLARDGDGPQMGTARSSQLTLRSQGGGGGRAGSARGSARGGSRRSARSGNRSARSGYSGASSKRRGLDALRQEIIAQTRTIQEQTAKDITGLVSAIGEESQRRQETEARLAALTHEVETQFKWGKDKVRGYATSTKEHLAGRPAPAMRDSELSNFGKSPTMVRIGQ